MPVAGASALPNAAAEKSNVKQESHLRTRLADVPVRSL